jgi:magnesium-transporting ATPase (P-type)
MEHKKIHIFPVLLRCEFNFFIMQLIVITNNKEYTSYEQNWIICSTSATCSFVIFQSLNVVAECNTAFSLENLDWTLEVNFTSIHKAGNFISTFRTKQLVK